MRVVKSSHVLGLCRVGDACGAGLDAKVCLSQAASLNENLDCEDSLVAQREMDEMGGVYVPAVESVGSSRGFFLSGRTRSTTILAMYGFVVKEDITMDVGDGRRAAQRMSRKVRTE